MSVVDASVGATVWRDVVGQDATVARLRATAARSVHAYLFAGPAGSSKKQAARAFAALLLTGSEDPTTRDADLILRGEHPDVAEVERTGASILKDQAFEVIRRASLTPVEADHKVMILDEFHLLTPEGAAVLLKTIEEPPPSTTFVILADSVPDDLTTIASRCVRVDFGVIPDATIASRLREDGVDEDTAVAAAAAAAGNLDRARLLAADPAHEARRQAFAAVPHQLDGRGATVTTIVDDLLQRIDAAAAPLAERQSRELAELQERVERYGQRGSGKADLETRHKRELRRHRTDELLAGLTVLAGVYRDALVAGTARRPDEFATAVTRIHEAIEAFELNPNEALLLQSLLWSLPSF